MDISQQVYNLIQKNPNLVFLKRYDKEWIFNSLSGICKAEKLEPTIENMQLFISTLESDLGSILSGAGSYKELEDGEIEE